MVMSTFIINKVPKLKGTRLQEPNFVDLLNNRARFPVVSAHY